MHYLVIKRLVFTKTIVTNQLHEVTHFSLLLSQKVTADLFDRAIDMLLPNQNTGVIVGTAMVILGHHLIVHCPVLGIPHRSVAGPMLIVYMLFLVSIRGVLLTRS